MSMYLLRSCFDSLVQLGGRQLHVSRVDVHPEVVLLAA